jgi:hypothetical protein
MYLLKGNAFVKHIARNAAERNVCLHLMVAVQKGKSRVQAVESFVHFNQRQIVQRQVIRKRYAAGAGRIGNGMVDDQQIKLHPRRQFNHRLGQRHADSDPRYRLSRVPKNEPGDFHHALAGDVGRFHNYIRIRPGSDFIPIHHHSSFGNSIERRQHLSDINS